MSERTRYQLRDAAVTYADGAELPVERLVLHYTPGPRSAPRDWILDIVIDGARRQQLAALHDAGVSPLGLPELIRFTINDPITLTYKPHGELAARLDVVEDAASIVTDNALHSRLQPEALDLRNYEFDSAAQGNDPRH